MRTISLATTAFAAALCLYGTVHAQDCGLVSDEAGILQGTIQANTLIDEGADVHVVTVQSLAKYGPRLASVESAYERSCPAWKAPNGQRKANLIVVMIAPNDRAKNIFFGSAYTGMFSGPDEVNSLYSRAANPYFRSKQWAEGVNATLKDLGSRVAVYHDQQKHPIQSEAPKAVVKVVLILVGVTGFFILLFVFLNILAKRRKDRAKTEAAQQGAIRARNQATDAFMAAPKDDPKYGYYSAKYTSLSNSVQYDPTTNGLSADSYDGIAADWRRLESLIKGVNPGQAGPAPSQAPTHHSNRSRKRNDWHQNNPQPTEPNAASSTVVVQNGSGNDLVTGMLLGEAISEESRPRYTEPEYHYRRESPLDTSGSSGSDSSWSSSSSSDDDSSSSGSDSSWGSSDSGSSDSGSSGSDSSW